MAAAQTESGKTPESFLRDLPFVGRNHELHTLSQGLGEAKASRGSTWLVEGPIGIGKTALVRELQKEAHQEGFTTLSGYGLKEVNTAFFLFQQVFRSRASRERSAPAALGPLPAVAIIEEERPERTIHEAARLSGEHPTLILTRDRPASLREKYPSLAGGTQLLWLSRAEGPDAIGPSNLDAIGERLTGFLQREKGGILVLAATEYLVTQNGFSAVLRLLQFLRDVAEETEGHLLLSLNPTAHEPREVSLLEGEGEVLAKGGAASEERAPAQSPTQTMLGFLDSLESEARRQPHLLILDDLQWADPDSLRTFQFLARNARGIPAMIVATLRTGDAPQADESEESNLLDVLDSMDREGTLHRVALAGLSEADAEKLFAGPVLTQPSARGPAGRITTLVNKTEGNPFVLRELLQQLASDGMLRKEGGHWVMSGPSGGLFDDHSGRMPLPETVRRLVARRLEYHDEGEREFLRWAAVQGSEFRLNPLASVMQRTSSDLVEIAQELARNHRILERRDLRGDDVWGFSQPLVWEIIRDEMTEAELRRRAVALAEWWAVNHPDEVDTVARLFHDAVEAKRGIPWIRQAINRALQGRSMETVERYHRWLQELLAVAGTPPETRVREGLEIAEQIEEHSGDSAELIRLLRSLLDLAPAGDLRLEVEAHIALPLAWLSPKEAAPLLERVRETVDKGSAAGVRIRYLLLLAEAVLHLREGRFDDQRKSARRVADEPGAPLWARVRALYYHGTSLCRLGRIEEAQATLAELERLPIPRSEPRLAAYVSGVKVFLAEALGDVGVQRESNETANALMGAVGNPYSIAIGLQNLGEARLQQGDLEGTRQCVREIQKLVERFDLPLRHLPLLLGGRLDLAERRWKEGLEKFTATKEEMVRLGNFEGYSSIRLLLAEISLWNGHFELAQREMADMKFDPARDPKDFEILRPLLEGWIEEAHGHPEEARFLLEKSLGEARTSQSKMLEAMTLNSLARWEARHDHAAGVKEHEQQANEIFDRIGVWKDGWLRSWPPVLPAVKPG